MTNNPEYEYEYQQYSNIALHHTNLLWNRKSWPRWLDRLNDNVFWRNRPESGVNIIGMDTQHLANTLVWLQHNASRIVEVLHKEIAEQFDWLAFLRVPTASGSNIKVIKATPLYKALALEMDKRIQNNITVVTKMFISENCEPQKPLTKQESLALLRKVYRILNESLED